MGVQVTQLDLLKVDQSLGSESTELEALDFGLSAKPEISAKLSHARSTTRQPASKARGRISCSKEADVGKSCPHPA